MAGTQTIYVTGESKWARVYQDQMDTEYGEKFHITVYPDEASLIALKAAGCRLKERNDDQGTFFKFSRDNKKEFKPGEIEVLGPPKVVYKSDDEYKPFTDRIGNGSLVTVKLQVYNSKKGTGTRLEAVCVDKHVPYEGREADVTGYKF